MPLIKMPGKGTGGRNAWVAEGTHGNSFWIERNNDTREQGGLYFIKVKNAFGEGWTTLNREEMVDLFNAFLEMEEEYDQNS